MRKLVFAIALIVASVFVVGPMFAQQAGGADSTSSAAAVEPASASPGAAAPPVAAPSSGAKAATADPAIAFPENPYYQAIYAKTVSEIDDRNRERIQFYWSFFSGIVAALVAVLSLIGFGQLRDLRKTISESVVQDLRIMVNDQNFRRDLRREIEASLLGDIEKRVNTLRHDMMFVRMQVLAEKVRQGTAFSNAERDTLLGNAVTLKHEAPDLTKTDEFAVVLESIMDSFFAAGLWKQLDVLSAEFGDLIRSKPGHTQTMMQAYGMRVLGDDDLNPERVASFHDYAEACKTLRYYESSINYLLAYNFTFQPADWKKRIQSLLFDYQHLNDADKERAIRSFTRFLDPAQLAKEPAAPHLRLAARFGAFLEAYRADLTRVDPQFAEMAVLARL